MAIGYANSYNKIFKIVKDAAFIVIAYPSSDAQRKLFKYNRG